MFTSQSTVERRAAKEKRLSGIEERLSILENVGAVDQERLASLEEREAPTVDLSSIETRLITLEENKLTTLMNRVSALEALGLSDTDSRLAKLEFTLVALESTLKTLTARSDGFSENATDMRRRLESAETTTTILRKELDDMKVAAKKPVTTGASKNFAFPAKKKEESTDA